MNRLIIPAPITIELKEIVNRILSKKDINVTNVGSKWTTFDGRKQEAGFHCELKDEVLTFRVSIKAFKVECFLYYLCEAAILCTNLDFFSRTDIENCVSDSFDRLLDKNRLLNMKR